MLGGLADVVRPQRHAPPRWSRARVADAARSSVSRNGGALALRHRRRSTPPPSGRRRPGCEAARRRPWSIWASRSPTSPPWVPRAARASSRIGCRPGTQDDLPPGRAAREGVGGERRRARRRGARRTCRTRMRRRARATRVEARRRQQLGDQVLPAGEPRRRPRRRTSPDRATGRRPARVARSASDSPRRHDAVADVGAGGDQPGARLRRRHRRRRRAAGWPPPGRGGLPRCARARARRGRCGRTCGGQLVDAGRGAA